MPPTAPCSSARPGLTHARATFSRHMLTPAGPALGTRHAPRTTGFIAGFCCARRAASRRRRLVLRTPPPCRRPDSPPCTPHPTPPRHRPNFMHAPPHTRRPPAPRPRSCCRVPRTRRGCVPRCNSSNSRRRPTLAAPTHPLARPRPPRLPSPGRPGEWTRTAPSGPTSTIPGLARPSRSALSADLFAIGPPALGPPAPGPPALGPPARLGSPRSRPPACLPPQATRSRAWRT